LKNAGFILNRDEHNRISLNISASTVYSATYSESKDNDSVSAGYSRGSGKTLRLGFDSDDQASVFICKMLLGRLDSDDVRLAAKAASGKTRNSELSVSYKHKILEDLVSTDPILNDYEAGRAAMRGYKNPLVENYANDANLSKIQASFNYASNTKTIVDESGTVEETYRRYNLDSNIAYFASFVSDDNQDTAEVLADKTRELTSEVDESGDLVGSDDSFINSKIDDARLAHVESFHSVHTSCFNYIDSASDLTISPDLTRGHLKELERFGLLSDTLKNKLIFASKNGVIQKVTMNYQLKKSVIEKYRDNPAQLEREAENVKDNYEFSEFRVEFNDARVRERDFLVEFINSFSPGAVPFTKSAVYNGNHFISVKANNL